MQDRTLLIVSATLDQEAREAVATGRWPRKDFFELKRALAADVVDYAGVRSRSHWRLLSRVIGIAATQAVIGFARRRRYARIVTDGEHIGIPLALLLRLSRQRPRHVTIGHLLSARSKRAVFRWLRPQRRIDAVALHALRQRTIATEQLGIPGSAAALVPYGVDPDFWRTEATPDEERLICAVGLEYRDYPTLIEAVRGLPVRLVIAAGSHWSTHRDAGIADLPANVEVTTLDYLALRDLYARARFVVVPLHDVENQAGITVLLEAMAMRRAVIVTATRGQRDVVRGRLVTAMGIAGEPMGGPRAFGASGQLLEDESGLYVPSADPAALRRAIVHLLEHPDEAARLGAAGRRLVTEWMSLDHFVQRIVSLVEATPVAEGDPAPARTVTRATLRPARSEE